jgi:hypothetical protein
MHPVVSALQPPGIWMLLIPVALAAADTLMVAHLPAHVLDGSFSSLALASALFFGFSSVIAAFKLPKFPFLGVVSLMLGGIVVGIIIDVIADSILHSADRNLFPFEIAYLWLVSVVPIAIGTYLGRLVYTTRYRDQ